MESGRNVLFHVRKIFTINSLKNYWFFGWSSSRNWSRKCWVLCEINICNGGFWQSFVFPMIMKSDIGWKSAVLCVIYICDKLWCEWFIFQLTTKQELKSEILGFMWDKYLLWRLLTFICFSDVHEVWP